MADFPRSYLRPLLVAMLILICLGMARLQLWRAETRSEQFERTHAALLATPINLSSQLRDKGQLVDRAARARGRWLSEKTLFLDNRLHHGRAGYHVLTPLRLAGGDAVVLVNRGWVAAPRLRTEIPAITTPAGELEIAGIARGFETRVFELQKTGPQGPIWQHVREADYLRISGLDALPVILLQTGAEPDGLIRDWSQPENPARKHYGYAAMWLAFALMAMGYGVLVWKKK